MAGAVKFASFEFDPQKLELRKAGRHLTVPDQSLVILSMLLEHPGDVVSRESIMERLWPDGTVVEFDHSISVAVRRLREALSDSADAPRYVETLPRRGYRFLADVEQIQTVEASRQYRILGEIGRGAMGVVYRAEDLRLHRYVALKFLPEEHASYPPALERFRREAQSLAAINHPGICTLYGIDEHEGRPCLVMECLEGRPLNHLIQGRPLELDAVLQIGIQVADALASAHRAGIIHRDLKPANIMIGDDGRAKILDFGVAKLIAQEEVAPQSPAKGPTPYGSTRDRDAGSGGVAAITLTATYIEAGRIAGTAAYMSPEQAEGREMDACSDIFSFGSVLYEMATGRRAFSGGTTTSTLEAVVRDEPDPVREIAADVPPGVESVIVRCLSKRPEHRFQSMAEVRIALEGVKAQCALGQPSAPAKSARRLLVPLSILASLLLAASGIGLVWRLRAPADAPAPPAVTEPLTTYPGSESSPSFSPDGNLVAFCWDGPKQDNFDIYVKLVGAEKPLRLTSDPAPEFAPAWSPDGRSIAFLRYLREYTAGVFLIPAIGGTERKLAEIRPAGAALAWSIDGKWLAYSGNDSDSPLDQTSSLYALSTETGERCRLTFAPRGASDALGAFSPDGRSLVFTRETRNYSSELYVLAISGDLRPDGRPQPITVQRRFSHNPAWTSDGREIVFMNGTSASMGLWRVPVSGSRPPQRLEFAGDRVGSFAVSPRGNRLVYERGLGDFDIWRLELNGGRAGRPMKLIASTWNDSVPEYSPDGKRIAFDSTRSGHNEVWLCRADGSDPIQLTFLSGQQVGPPRWSPDGKRIVFDYNVDGDFDVYVIDAEGGRPRRLTDDPANDALPSFSHDGRWIYFASSRTGRYEMWKMPSEGGKPVQVTTNGGWVGFESPDEKYLYYAKHPAASSLWKIPVDGGSEQRIGGQIIGSSLAVANKGLYFAVPQRSGAESAIEFLSFSSGKTTVLATIPQPIFWSMSVSADERYLLYSQPAQYGSDLMLVENF